MNSGRIIKSKFIAPLYLKHPCLQTSLGILNLAKPKVAETWEEIILPDGDSIELCWFGNQAEGAIAMLIPGLEGGRNAHYLSAMVQPLLAQGWRVVVVHFRSCGKRMNELPRGYSAADSDDLLLVTASIRMQNPGVNIVAIGFSLGGSVLLKLLSELADCYYPSNYIQAAVGISVPYQLNLAVDKIPQFFQWRLLKSMKSKVAHKIKAGIKMPVNLKELKSIHTLREFDEKITAPLSGYSSADDYYQASSCRPHLSKILPKTLLLHALDDPFIPREALPGETELAENTVLECSEHGGHLGFLEQGLPWRNWTVPRVLEFINPYRQFVELSEEPEPSSPD